MEEKLKAHFLNLYHMALSDTEIDTRELEMLYLIGEEKGITKTEINSVVLAPDTIKFVAPETILEKIGYLYDFARIAWADGRIDENEKRLLKMFSEKFEFVKENIPSIVQFLLDEAQKDTPKEEVFKIVNENL